MPIYKDHIKSKLPKSETNIFTIMSQLANNHNAINLSQGFPDFDVDPLLINTVKKYLDKNYHQYAPMQGALKLREQINAEKAKGEEADKELIKNLERQVELGEDEIAALEKKKEVFRKQSIEVEI